MRASPRRPDSVTGERTDAPGRPTTERVRGIFSNIAGQYDSFNRISSLGIDRSWRKELVKAAALTSTSRVLDLCAGTGDVALAVAKQAAPAEVVITDFTPEMLEIAAEKAKSYEGPTKLAIEQADAQDLPFDDESFDAATVAFGVRNLPDRAANFAEVRRVLKPGGRYIILEFSRPTFAPWRGFYHVYLRYVIPAIGGALTGDRPSFQYLNDSIRQFPTQPQLASELRDAGFTAITWKNLTGGVAALHTAVR
ncbi:MAG: bifunctional demethylmenaquinone methyltransferase/2-methoxy-6-polyprenyl-1,4-benzoquinol methylase UbiE [Coriobacteriales bacterium]|nr:bifunctional demethylmenaquinone methyltransferase/2-methoxy-6-polyprenyl-1,4-benzoquinol methylase UbiE [Coriobacteriales bacterium]